MGWSEPIGKPIQLFGELSRDGLPSIETDQLISKSCLFKSVEQIVRGD